MMDRPVHLSMRWTIQECARPHLASAVAAEGGDRGGEDSSRRRDCRRDGQAQHERLVAAAATDVITAIAAAVQGCIHVSTGRRL